MKQTEGTGCAVSRDGNDPYHPGGQCGLVIGVRGAKAAAGRSAPVSYTHLPGSFPLSTVW